MNFSKDYIELCKNPKVQGLRKELETDDRFIDKAFYKYLNRVYTYELNAPPLLHDVNENREKIIWLPCSDQLDDEIVKICRGKKWAYCFRLVNMPDEYKDYEVYINDSDCDRYEYFNETNPLIAKIKLLIALLEEE